jgi:hypothetical protein
MAYIKLGFCNEGYCLSKKNNVSCSEVDKFESKSNVDPTKGSKSLNHVNKCPVLILFQT